MIPCEKSESVAGYALGSLDPEDRQKFERHLATCEACQADLRAYQRVMGELALAAPAVEPSARLRAAILQKAVPARPAPQSLQPARPGSGGSWLGRIFQAHSPAFAVAGLVLIVALVFSNVFLWSQVNQRQQAQATPFHMVTLHSPDPNNDAKALLVISDDGQFGTLISDNLTILNDQSQYQLWLVKDGTRTNGGLFTVNDAGYGWLKIQSKTSLLEYQSFGITVEPAGGSLTPTGPKVLGGAF